VSSVEDRNRDEVEKSILTDFSTTPQCFLAPAFAGVNLSPRKRGARTGASVEMT